MVYFTSKTDFWGSNSMTFDLFSKEDGKNVNIKKIRIYHFTIAIIFLILFFSLHKIVGVLSELFLSPPIVIFCFFVGNDPKLKKSIKLILTLIISSSIFCLAYHEYKNLYNEYFHLIGYYMVLFIGIMSNLAGILTDSLMKKNKDQEKIIQEKIKETKEKDIMLLMQSRQAILGDTIHFLLHQWKQSIIVLDSSYGLLESKSCTFDVIQKDLRTHLDHLLSTVNNFSSFIKDGKNKEIFNIKDSIEEALSITGGYLKEINTKIIFDSKDIYVNNFKHQYSQVILNILINAKEVFYERDIKNPIITIEMWEDDENAYLTISDNGGGVENDYIFGKLFAPYFTTKEKGTGIGLYMSKKIVEDNMKGKIGAKRIENGMEFKIIIPKEIIDNKDS